jgi:hypothetical protein
MARHHKSTVVEAIDQLNRAQLAASGSSSKATAAAQRKLEALQEIRQGTAKGFLPSGKRQPGVGCNDEVRWLTTDRRLHP